MTYDKLEGFYHESLGTKASAFITMSHEGYCHRQIYPLRFKIKDRMLRITFTELPPKPAEQIPPFNFLLQAKSPQHDLGVFFCKHWNPTPHWKTWPENILHPHSGFAKSDCRGDQSHVNLYRNSRLVNATPKVPVYVALVPAGGCNLA